jgi:hypothetical protein
MSYRNHNLDVGKASHQQIFNCLSNVKPVDEQDPASRRDYSSIIKDNCAFLHEIYFGISRAGRRSNFGTRAGFKIPHPNASVFTKSYTPAISECH